MVRTRGVAPCAAHGPGVREARMKRAIQRATILAATLLLAGVGMTGASAAKPGGVTEPSPNGVIEFGSDGPCTFPIRIEPIEDDVTVTAWPAKPNGDVVEVYSGHLIAVATNLRHGESPSLRQLRGALRDLPRRRLLRRPLRRTQPAVELRRGARPRRPVDPEARQCVRGVRHGVQPRPAAAAGQGRAPRSLRGARCASRARLRGTWR